MSRTQRKQSREKAPGAQPAVIVGVLLLIGVVLILKAQRSAVGPANPQNEIERVAPVAETVTPAQPSPTPTLLPELLPEAQLDQFLTAGKPTLAFVHSTICEKCVRMSEIVQQVYPDFADTVALVDVDVYDTRNTNLLQHLGIRVIPTLIFIDRTGQGQGYMGVMEPDAFREQLQALAGE